MSLQGAANLRVQGAAANPVMLGHVNLSGGDYHLAPWSPYKNMGTDGTDIGADIDAVNAATACAMSVACGN